MGAASRLCSVGVSLMLAGGLHAEEAATDGCETLSSLSAEALETYQFESDERTWRQLPKDGQYRIREIRVVRQPIFEAPRDWVQRGANRYHVVTREKVVRAVLPVVPGATVDARRLDEAERILRSRIYLYDARVIPRRVCGDDLDVDVVTRDVWTLNPRLILSRSGGEDEFGFGVSDSNWFGSGKTFSVGYRRDQDRKGVSVTYGDPNVFGSRWSAWTTVVDNDDGHLAQVRVERPFFALDVPYTVGVSAASFEREHDVHFLGDDLFSFDAESRFATAYGGVSSGVDSDGFVHRLTFGLRYEEHEFDLPPEFGEERKFAYPFIGYQRLETDFDKRLNVDRIQRTEDIALGTQTYVELGYSSDALGGEGDHVLYRGSFRHARWLTPRQLMILTGDVSGEYDLDLHQTENLVANVAGSYRYNHAQRFSFFALLSASGSRRLPVDKQILLGGDTGLRGYPNRFQVGDRRVVLSVEERYFSDIYPLKMFRLGAAVFADVGRAWFDDEAPFYIPSPRNGEAFDVIADVGVGLRLESTRTRRDLIVHLDIAKPLTDGPDVRGVEVTLSAKRSL